MMIHSIDIFYYLYHNVNISSHIDEFTGIDMIKKSKISENAWFGPLAQLVERFHGMEEVAGPNPAWSTITLQKWLTFLPKHIHPDSGIYSCSELSLN